MRDKFPDALVKQQVTTTRNFINWGRRNDVKVYFNEIGTPYHHSENDANKWNRLLGYVLREINLAGVPAVCWSDNGNPNYPFAPFQGTVDWGDLSVTQYSGRPWMDFWRGAQRRDSGLYLGQGHQNSVWGNASTTQNTGEHKQYFSNVNRGVLNTDYAWNSAADVTYLAARNMPCGWVSFRWERMAPTPGGALDATYLAALIAVVDALIAGGVNVVVQCFNKGAYYLDNGGSPSHGVRHRIGNTGDGSTITNAVFADLWSRLATALSGKGSRFLGYAIMNEPSTGSMTLWESASQAAVDAITLVDATRNVYVSVLTWQPIQNVASAHPTPWITGTLADAGKILYGHSLYFQDGNYTETYDEVLARVHPDWDWLDEFPEADGAITSGTRRGTYGRTYALTSTVSIKGNALAPTTNSGEFNRVPVIVNGKFQIKMQTWDTTTGGREQWFYFRKTFNPNNDGWRFGLSGSTWYLQYYTGGVQSTPLSNKTLTDAPIASDQLVEIEINGPFIRCTVGDVVVYEHYSTYLQGAGMAGITFTNTPNARVDWVGMRPIHDPIGLYS